jgi:hypothetical protein
VQACSDLEASRTEPVPTVVLTRNPEAAPVPPETFVVHRRFDTPARLAQAGAALFAVKAGDFEFRGL